MSQSTYLELGESNASRGGHSLDGSALLFVNLESRHTKTFVRLATAGFLFLLHFFLDLERLHPLVRGVHGDVDAVVGAVLLRHPEDANGKNGVRHPSEVVVGLPRVSGSAATELPDFGHTPGSSASSKDLKDPPC